MKFSEKKNRLRLLRGASRVFLRKGYAKTRMEDFVEESKIGKKTLYEYYSNKEEVLKAAAEYRQSKAAFKMQRIRKNRFLDFPGRFIRMRIELLDVWKPSHFSLWKELQDQIPEIWRMVKEKRVQLIDREITYLLEEGKKLGEFRADLHPDLFIMALLACSDAVYQSGECPTDRRAGISELDNIFLYGIIRRGNEDV
ncbi:TetR/AcrR family transcriptional regulator [Leptospira sarikeiensis]|uniref:TetR/AcrR family transcriptional regulator n=2 Tax=Leptospira sarikeiensis TaxID=2484943 RepID=A0A4R9K775_9LEPT|nr:TetR/AcrR family transcriptional regulator [Leptospira sarikeiensis]TGL61497.1 TetR/AcrR family transcriptional regulator [Leptospira sarikeiensis]